MRAGLEASVVLAGRVDDMPGLLGALDIVATLSGGSVMFEAMASGKAVLSVRADGLHSAHTRHDETAWCVTTGQAQEAAAGLARLMDDAALRARLGAAGRTWVRRELGVERMVAQTVAVYEQLLAPALSQAQRIGAEATKPA